MRISLGFPVRIVIALTSLTAATGSAQADPVPFAGGSLPGTDSVWSVSTSPGVTMSFDAARPPYTTVGTLIVGFTHVNNDAFWVHFRQDFEQPTSDPASGGLRLNFDATITNRTDTTWSGYQLQLTDDTWPPPNDPESGVHPPPPHFHPRAGAGGATRPTFGPFTVDRDTLDDPATLLQIGDGGAHLVGAFQDFTVQNLLIHERYFALGVIPDPGRREFTLYGAPIVLPSGCDNEQSCCNTEQLSCNPDPSSSNPEPSTLTLLGLTTLGLGVYGWRRRKRAA